jgi:RNA polymerase sigma factor (sigma-70 family)
LLTISLRKAGRKADGDPDQSNPEASLKDLLGRALAADWGAWMELEKKYSNLLMHTARGVGLSHSDAADVAQLTWLRLWQHGHQIREPERLPAWLAATARREAVRVAISKKRYVLYADPTVEHSDGHRTAVHDTYEVDGEYEPATEQALARLPGRYQELIRLLMSDNCPSYTEVAKILNLPIGSIGPMRMRALKMLRRTPELATMGAR